MGEKQDKVEELAHHKVGKVPRVVVEDGLVVLHKLLNDRFLKILENVTKNWIHKHYASPHPGQVKVEVSVPEQLHRHTWRPH